MAEKIYSFILRGNDENLRAAIERSAQGVDSLGAKVDSTGRQFSAAGAGGDRLALGLRPADVAVKSLGISAGQTTAALRQLPAQITDIVTQLAGGQNPLLILTQQGGQIKDSFGGIGPTLDVARQAITPLRLVLGGVAAAAAAVGYAFYEGAAQSKAFADSQLITGRAAGITEGQLNALTRSVAANGTVTVGAAREIAQALASTGQVGPRVFSAATVAGALYAKATGKNAEDVAKDFAGMSADVAKWAAEHNKQLNFITAAQYDQIKSLQENGRAAEAQGIVYDALTRRFKDVDQNLGYLGKTLQAGKNLWSGFWDSAFDLGRTETLEAKLERASAAVDALRGRQAIGRSANPAFSSAPALRPGDTAGEDARTTNLLATQTAVQIDLARRVLRQQDNAFADADRAETNQAAIAFKGKLDAVLVKAKTQGEYLQKVAEFKAGFQVRAEAGSPVSEADQKAALEQLRKDFTPKGNRAAERLDTRFEDRRNALTADGIKLDAEIRSFELYGRSVDKARVAVLDLEIAQGKLKGLDPKRIAELRALASADDAKDRALDQAKINAEVDKSIGQLREQATLKQANARDSEVATRLAELEAKGVKAGTETYIENAASIRLWVGVKHDQALARKLAADQAETDLEVERLDEETRALTLSTAERQKSVVALRLHRDAQRDIAANPGQTEQILEAEITRRDALTAAIDRNYAASRRFETGAAQAMAKFREDVGDEAAFGGRLVEGGLDRAAEALFEFEKTGKLRLGNLWRFMADEFLRQQSRMFLKDLVTPGNWLDKLVSTAKARADGSYNENYGNEGRRAAAPDAALQSEAAAAVEAGNTVKGAAEAQAAVVGESTAALDTLTAAAQGAASALALVGRGPGTPVPPDASGFAAFDRAGLGIDVAGAGYSAAKDGLPAGDEAAAGAQAEESWRKVTSANLLNSAAAVTSAAGFKEASTAIRTMSEVTQLASSALTLLQSAAGAGAATGGSGWAGIVSSVVGIFSGGSGLTVDTAGTGITNAGTGSLVDNGLGGGRANGGSVAARSTHPVVENGPELLRSEGKDYLLMGGASGYITPLSQQGARDSAGGSGGQGGNVYITNMAPAQVEARRDEAGDWQILIKEAVRQAKNEVASDIARGYGGVPSALRAKGVSLNGSNPRRN